MGIMNHEAILATTWCEHCIERAKRFIDKLPDDQKQLFTIMGPFTNGMFTIILAPSGCKKHCPEDEKISILRNEFIGFINQDDEGHMGYFSWVEVSYGE